MHRDEIMTYFWVEKSLCCIDNCGVFIYFRHHWMFFLHLMISFGSDFFEDNDRLIGKRNKNNCLFNLLGRQAS